jgi:lysophospholipase L1-like esterase
MARNLRPSSFPFKLPLVLSLAVVAALIAVVSLPAEQSEAGPGSGPTAIVSLGDSFISGEAGRWSGNSLNMFGTRDGTDRAASCWWIFCSYDPEDVYGSSYSNGCHRSDVATIKSASISVNKKINLACSGARSVNIWRASQGGQSYKGEAPQADRLLTVAQQNDVKMVVLTISANDIGFADRVINCTVRWILSLGPCGDAEQATIESLMPAAKNDLRKSIDEIRAVMAQAGYSQSQYKLVLAGYSSPVPATADVRYSGDDKWWTGGCPFYDSDFDWAKQVATPYIVDNMRDVAAEKGVQFLDVRDALNGHEVCHQDSSLVTSSPNSRYHEWVRWVNTGCCQGDAQESVHPNAFGQKAIGKCVALMYAKPSGNWTCNNTPGGTYNQMSLSAIP